MNHDCAHCADYQKDCPKQCFRGELVRDLRQRPELAWLPTSWIHFRGTKECLKGDGEDG